GAHGYRLTAKVQTVPRPDAASVPMSWPWHRGHTGFGGWIQNPHARQRAIRSSPTSPPVQKGLVASVITGVGRTCTAAPVVRGPGDDVVPETCAHMSAVVARGVAAELDRDHAFGEVPLAAVLREGVVVAAAHHRLEREVVQGLVHGEVARCRR